MPSLANDHPEPETWAVAIRVSASGKYKARGIAGQVPTRRDSGPQTTTNNSYSKPKKKKKKKKKKNVAVPGAGEVKVEVDDGVRAMDRPVSKERDFVTPWKVSTVGLGTWFSLCASCRSFKRSAIWAVRSRWARPAFWGFFVGWHRKRNYIVDWIVVSRFSPPRSPGSPGRLAVSFGTASLATPLSWSSQASRVP